MFWLKQMQNEIDLNLLIVQNEETVLIILSFPKILIHLDYYLSVL